MMEPESPLPGGEVDQPVIDVDDLMRGLPDKLARFLGRSFGGVISNTAYGLSQLPSVRDIEGSKRALIRAAFERELSEFFGE